MNNKLNRYKPEIVETAFSGRKQAVMAQCKNGAWFHYEEVEKLLAEKDKDIDNLRKELISLRSRIYNASEMTGLDI